MKVSTLIFLLQECDPDALVVLSSDAEGNKYSPLCPEQGVDTESIYVAGSTYSGEVYSCRDEDPEDGVAAVVLYPIN